MWIQEDVLFESKSMRTLVRGRLVLFVVGGSSYGLSVFYAYVYVSPLCVYKFPLCNGYVCIWCFYIVHTLCLPVHALPMQGVYGSTHTVADPEGGGGSLGCKDPPTLSTSYYIIDKLKSEAFSECK